MTIHAIHASELLKQRVNGFTPKIALVLGSGLGNLVTEIEQPLVVSYEDLPGFHCPKVQGHAGQFVFGFLRGVPVMCFQGRAHLYEGISTEVIQTMIRTSHLMGCKFFMTTGAVGSLHREIVPGNLVLIKDHINFQFTNPLVGMNDDRFGTRFPGMDNAYDAVLRERVLEIACSLQIELREGVYLSTLGPSFETPAEIRMFQQWGADVVGMSVVPEVIVALHCGMRVVAFALVTNLASGLHPGVISHEETLFGASLGEQTMRNLISEVVADLGKE